MRHATGHSLYIHSPHSAFSTSRTSISAVRHHNYHRNSWYSWHRTLHIPSFQPVQTQAAYRYRVRATMTGKAFFSWIKPPFANVNISCRNTDFESRLNDSLYDRTNWFQRYFMDYPPLQLPAKTSTCYRFVFRILIDHQILLLRFKWCLLSPSATDDCQKEYFLKTNTIFYIIPTVTNVCKCLGLFPCITANVTELVHITIYHNTCKKLVNAQSCAPFRCIAFIQPHKQMSIRMLVCSFQDKLFLNSSPPMMWLFLWSSSSMHTAKTRPRQ